MNPLTEELKKHFSHDDILSIYKKEFDSHSKNLVNSYFNSDEFKESIKSYISYKIYNYFLSYKSKYKALGNKGFYFNYSQNSQYALSNALLDEFVDNFSNEIISKFLGGKQID